MKHSLFLILLILSVLSLKVLAAVPLSLEQVHLTGFKKTDTMVWTHERNKNLVVVAQEMKDAWFELRESEVSEYLQKLTEVRDSVNFFAGIKDWSIHSHHFKSEKQKKILTFEGRFKQGQVTTYFREQQVFIEPHIYQVKVSSTSSSDLDSPEASKVFETFWAGPK